MGPAGPPATAPPNRLWPPHSPRCCSSTPPSGLRSSTSCGRARPRLSGLHVDENWHEYGDLAYDLKIDARLARACASAATRAGVKSKAVNYDGFPVDTGTIVAAKFLNPNGRLPLLIASNNLYHDFRLTQKLGRIAAAQARRGRKRAAVVGGR